MIMEPVGNDPLGSSASPSKHKKTSTGSTMVECLESDDPIASLQMMASSSAEMVMQYSRELQKVSTGCKDLSASIPPLLSKDSVSKILQVSSVNTENDHPFRTVMACSESIVSNLNKISSGGQQASNEIRTLEQKKRTLDHHAAVVLAAVTLRKQSTLAVQSYQSQSYYEAAEAIRPWLLWKQHQQQQQQQQQAKNQRSKVNPSAATGDHNDDDDDDDDDDDVMNDPRLAMYTGEYSLQQLQVTYDSLRTTLLSLYETAVQASDLQTLGTLTPILAIIQLEFDGLRLYKVYLLSVLEKSMKDVAAGAAVTDSTKSSSVSSQQQPPYVAMGRVYNVAVSILRHHLPMVSYCLYRADGDVGIVQLVHNQTELTIVPIVQQYQTTRQLARVSRSAIQIYAAIEDRYTGRGIVNSNHKGNTNHDNDDTDDNNDDCGFSHQIGTLSDVDVTMEEVAMCIQHTESYLRFVQHTCLEVNRARKLRHDQSMERTRLERERHEWTKSSKGTNSNAGAVEDDKTKKGDEIAVHYDIEILSQSTPLHECIAEVGGQYAAIERCLLIASMQKAFDYTNDDDPKSYRPMSTLSSSSSSSNNNNNGNTGKNNTTPSSFSVDAWQTMLVETCWYAARRGTQRAFATGHTGTASAVTNFVVECLTDVCLPVLTRRGEEYGIQPLKPGDGLLVGSINLFNNASNLIRQGGGAVTSLQLPTSVTTTTNSGGGKSRTDELFRKQKREEGIIRACAMMNDIEVAIHHTKQLESILYKLIDKGFPPNTHETEHLRMCVKALSPVADAFRLSSNTTMETFETTLKPRIRSIVGDAVGVSDTSASTFIGAVTTTTLGGGGGAKSHFGDHHGRGSSDMTRMNYDLDEEAYNLLQLSEGYVTRLGTLLDELLNPIRKHLAPRLWDILLLHVVGAVCKRLEILLRKCEFTELGGLAFDSDLRDLVSYTKDHLHSPDYNSNTNAVLKACPALAKLLQMAKLLQAEFENATGNELLRLPDDE